MTAVESAVKSDKIWCVFVRASLHTRREENQLDVTECFIALMIRSTCFGHFYAHHQELETTCVLLPPMVCSAVRVKRYALYAVTKLLMNLCVSDDGKNSPASLCPEASIVLANLFVLAYWPRAITLQMIQFPCFIKSTFDGLDTPQPIGYCPWQK